MHKKQHGYPDLRAISNTLVAAYRATTSLAYPDLAPTSLAESKTNYANPGTYDLVGNVTWNSLGWSGFSESNYLNTGIVMPDDSQTWSVFIKYSGNGGAYYPTLFGTTDGVNAYGLLYFIWSTNTIIASINGAGVVIPIGDGFTQMAIVGNAVYANLVNVGTLPLGTYNHNLSTYIGCRNFNGAGNLPWSGQIQGAIFYSSVITDVAGVMSILQAC
ncbi:MAG: hypothetical protein E6Q36_05705 [Chryseobacterium sp.]|nr:MAG: hypothetical protein E6Q36_05705 [Chryseobacterium sp.]